MKGLVAMLGTYARDQLLDSVLSACLDEQETAGCTSSPQEVANDAIATINGAIKVRNDNSKGEGKWRYLDSLDPPRIATCLIRLNGAVRISLTDDPDSYVIGIYVRDGAKEGLHIVDDAYLNALCRHYNSSLTKRDIAEIKAILLDIAPLVERCLDPNLVPVNNGIFNYETKTLMPFDSKYVFLSKSSTDYNPNAQNVIITNPDGTEWDVESWIESLVSNLPDKSEMADLIWKIIGAMVRYLVPWNKAVFLISPKGNNGKGTLCELMRSLLGKGNSANIPITSFCKEFMLEPLIHANAVITDENDVGMYIDAAANFKAAVTGDEIQLNRKYKTPITFRFRGFILQCLNDYPNYRDKSDSLYRRQLCVPMTQCFTGTERKYIKTDYVHRKEVLEYVLFKVLNMDYDQLPEPESCKIALDKSKDMNDPVLQFMNEMMGQFVWDLVPFTFLYSLYKSWYKRNVSDNHPPARNRFIEDLKRNLYTFPQWCLHQDEHGIDKEVRSKGRMEEHEPLIAEYDLSEWKNPNYMGHNVQSICTPILNSKYRGIIRTKVAASCDQDAEAEAAENIALFNKSTTARS